MIMQGASEFVVTGTMGGCGSFFDGEAGPAAAFERLAALQDADVKILTPTWNGKDALASGHNTGDGLSRFGREVVSLLEERRIAVDASRLNNKGFDELVRLARPFAASRPNLRSVCGHRRNLTDDRFRAICDAEGIVGMNFCRGFLREDSADPTRDDAGQRLRRMRCSPVARSHRKGGSAAWAVRL